MTRRKDGPGGCIDPEGGSAILMILIALAALIRQRPTTKGTQP